MSEQLTPSPSSVSRRARTCGASLLTVALLCGSLAFTASAQTPSASRERRADVTTGAAPQKDAPAPKDEAGNAQAEKDGRPVESKEKAGAEIEVVVSMSGEGADGAEIEALRSRVEAESDVAARGRLRLALAGRLADAGRKAEAVAMLRVMLAEERFDPAFFYNAGNALARLDESGAAVEAYRKAAAQRRGNYSRAQHNLGVVLIRLGRWEEAQEALTAALRLEHFAYAEASYNLGRLHALRGEAGLAMQEWARTLRIKPDHADAAVALARALAEDGDPEEGLAVLDSVGARFTRGGGSVPREVSIARGEIVAARNVVASGRVEKVSSVETRPSSSSSSPARESKSAARLRPLSISRDSYSLLKRAREAREAGRAEESVALYRRVVEGAGGYFPPANLEMGYALAALGRHEEAVASLRGITERGGERYPIAFYHLGRYYEYLGRLEQAGASFERAAALLGHETPQFLLDVSRVREKEGKWAESLAATEDYVRAVERMGAVPDWARERLERLRLKASPATGAQK